MISGIDFLFCILGWVLLCLFNFSRYKNELDKNSKDFELKKYAKITWDNWLFSFICAIAFLFVGPQLILFLSSSILIIQLSWSYKTALFIGAFSSTLFDLIYNYLINKKIKK